MAKFHVSYSFHGRTERTIEAESKEALEAKIEAEIEREDFEIDADEIDSIDYHVTEMHPVVRDGREVWTTYIRATDVRGHPSALATSPLFGGAE